MPRSRRFLASTGVAAVLGLALALGGRPAPTVIQAQTSGDSGQPGPASAGIGVNPHTLPEGDVPIQGHEVPAMHPVDEAAFGQMKAQANAAAQAQAHLPGNTHSGGNGSPTPKFATLGIQDTGGWNPPDGGLAVGPTSVLVAVNEAFAVYGKTIDATTGVHQRLLGPINFTSFFTPQTSDSIFDPRALYDAANGRFVLLAATSNTRSKTSSFRVAVSQGSSPENSGTKWCTYSFNAVTGSGPAASWADFPGLGMDGNNLYITSNQFSFGRNTFQYARILALPKSAVYPDAVTGACPAASGTTDFRNVKNPDGSTAFTVQPANQPDAVAGTTAMHFVNAIWSSGSQLAVRTITTNASGGSRTLGNASWVGVAAYNLPANVPQPAGSAIASGDTRLLDATERYGAIYTANTTQMVGAASLTGTTNAYANAQWYAISPVTSATGGISWTATSNAVADANLAYFFPGVMPGCAAMTNGVCTSVFVGLGASISSSTHPASAYSACVSVSGCNSNSPVSNSSCGNATAAYTLIGTGAYDSCATAGYTLNSRWGDYPGISLDPNDPGTIWVLGEWAAGTGAWGTAVESITPSGATP